MLWGNVSTKSHVLCSWLLQRPHWARTAAGLGFQCALGGGASGERGQPQSPGPRGTSQRRRSKGTVWRGLTRVRQHPAATLPLPPCPLPPRPVPFPLSRAVEDGTWLGVLPGVQCHAGRMHSPPRACSVILRHKDSSLLLMSGSVTGSWNSARDKGFRW